MRRRFTCSMAASLLLSMTTMSASADRSGPTGLEAIGGTGQPPTSISGSGEPPTAIGGTGQPPTAIGGTGEPPTAIGGTGQPPTSISGSGEPPTSFPGGFSTNALSGGSGAPSTGGRPSSVLAIGGTGLSQTSVSSGTVRSIVGNQGLALAPDRPSDIRASAVSLGASKVTGVSFGTPLGTQELSGSGVSGNSIGLAGPAAIPATVSTDSVPLNPGTAIR